MSKTNTFILQGKKSFSDSKLEQLNFDFNKSNNQESKIISKEIYILASQNAELNLNELKNILNADESLESFSFFIGPRSGTISPWSSKTEDIIKNVGVADIDRVEKFYGFTISSFSEKENLDLSMFFDRMTQSVYLSYEECTDFLNIAEQRIISHINIINEGINALKNANSSYGFAMSEDEIEYLYDFYSKSARNPTDAELMMFAQANSEHCRHKIFNAKWNIESGYDYVQIEISNDGGNTWTPQCGKYTKKGVETHDIALDQPLYDGNQSNWILESISLDDYINQEISVRFKLISDGGLRRDGFYFDDFKIKAISS